MGAVSAARRPDLRPSDRRRLESLLDREWSLPSAREHPLGRLQGRPLGTYRLLVLLGPKNNVGARYFQLHLVDAEGRLSDEAIALGLYNSGLAPAYNWIDLILYDSTPAFDPSTGSGQAPSTGSGQAPSTGSGQAAAALDLRAGGLEKRLFRLLSGLIPPGGHLMLEYESPGQRDSERVLTLGYPPVSSPLGYLLFGAGCLAFRDWYISEGGREGPRKLQGFKPLDEDVARQRTAALRAEMTVLLSAPPRREHDPWGRTARRLARSVLRALDRAPNRRR